MTRAASKTRRAAEAAPATAAVAAEAPASEAPAGTPATESEASGAAPVTEAPAAAEPVTGDRAALVAAIEGGRLSDALAAALVAALDAGALDGIGEGVRLALEPVEDHAVDGAALSADADAVLDAIVAGQVPEPVLTALRGAIEDGTLAAQTAFAPSRATTDADVRRFPVVSDVLHGGVTIGVGGTVDVTATQFAQLQAGLSIDAALAWHDGEPVSETVGAGD
ncbi:MAG: hypothetical protein VYB32_06240 [Pseudomonadota bacterium]|nr:hypothetical protein [Pseudomonadota bacterium]